MEKHRKEFQIPENLNFYSEKNYKIAERKYLKYALSMGGSKDLPESMTIRKAGGLDFTAIGGKGGAQSFRIAEINAVLKTQ